MTKLESAIHRQGWERLCHQTDQNILATIVVADVFKDKFVDSVRVVGSIEPKHLEKNSAGVVISCSLYKKRRGMRDLATR